MEDRTFLTNNHPTDGISDTFREYIEALVEEVVINGEPFEAQKKWLRKNSEAEGVEYETIESNLNDLFEAIKELEEHESKSTERLVYLLAKGCYLSEALVNKLIDNAAVVRVQKEAERKAQEEKKRKAQDEAKRKAKEKAERKTREEKERKAQEEAERKAKEETERRAREEAERKAKEESEKKQTTGELNGHKWVDLGLPSGTLWATCNVGANKPEEYGDYFSWGETCPNCEYNEYTNKYYEDFVPIKYTDKDHLKVLQPEDDAARANWGADWRMPTKEEWEELLDNTTHKWTKQNGVEGGLFTANNGNSLFLPAAGVRCDNEFFNAGDCGHYQSSSLYTDDPLLTWNFDCCSVNSDVYDGIRTDGKSVRPVCSAPQN